MSIVFSDNFPAVLNGINWSQQAGGWAWQTPSQVRCGTSASPAVLATTTTAHAAIADCLVTVTMFDTGGVQDGGPMLRAAIGGGGANTCYYLDVDCTGPAASVYRRVTGADTLLGSSDAVTEAANAVCALQASGTGATVTLKKFYRGSQVSSDISDTNAARLVTPGQTGILNWGSSPGTGDSDWDTFSVDDLVVAATRSWLLVR